MAKTIDAIFDAGAFALRECTGAEEPQIRFPTEADFNVARQLVKTAGAHGVKTALAPVDGEPDPSAPCDEPGELLNLTPHALNIYLEGGRTLVLPPSGEVARVTMTTSPIGDVGGVPLTRSVAGEIKDLPHPWPGVYLIVSSMVAAAAKREDVLAPGPLIRDSEGRPVGCQGLTRPW